MFSIPVSQSSRHGLAQPYSPRKRIRWLQKQNSVYRARTLKSEASLPALKFEISDLQSCRGSKRRFQNPEAGIQNPASHFWLKEPASDLPPNLARTRPQYAFLFWLVRSDTQQPVGLVRAIPPDRNKFPCHHPYRAAWLSGDTVETRHHSSLQSSRTYLERKFIRNYSGQRFPILHSEILGVHFGNALMRHYNVDEKAEICVSVCSVSCQASNIQMETNAFRKEKPAWLADRELSTYILAGTKSRETEAL
jgi:hypothetical protein